MSDLLAVVAAWVRHRSDEGGVLVLDLDEAVAQGAPWDGFRLQLAVTVPVGDADPDGQPVDDEPLLDWGTALVEALGEQGRVVATLTADGLREHLAYVRDASVVEGWRAAPPPGLGTHEASVVLVDDPTWKGLREVAGLLADGELPLVMPD